MSILLATSLAPGGRLEVQQAAVRSWLDHGFDVLSLNAVDEIAALKPDFTGVEFVPAPRTAASFIGKPLVFVNDLLDALAIHGGDVVGIINSDIRLEPIPGLMDALSAAARETLLIGPRLDVDQWDDPNGKADPIGADLFVFPRAMIPLWGATRLCLGQGYWDFWLPLMAICAGKPARKLLPPVGRHLRHATSRNDAFFLFASEFAGLAAETLQDPSYPAAEFRRLFAAAQSKELPALEALAQFIDGLTRQVIRFIDARARSSGVPISMKEKSPT
jgi:hypothetical protein